MPIFDTSSPTAVACNPTTLLELVKRGDAAALDQLTRCYGVRLMEVGRRQCKNEDRAQDAVQDALESAATHLGDFRAEGSLEGWLSRMVTNACRRMQRGRKADVSLHEPFSDEQAGGVADPEELTSNQGLGLQLVEALKTLSAQDRAIVLLAEVNGWKGPEIAESLSLSPGQVRTRLSRSRAHLREELAEIWQEWQPGERKDAEA